MVDYYLPYCLPVSVNVNDWVDVQCDYSPGVCSEGGTGVVIAKSEGTNFFSLHLTWIMPSCLSRTTGVMTVKYTFGPGTVAAARD